MVWVESKNTESGATPLVLLGTTEGEMEPVETGGVTTTGLEAEQLAVVPPFVPLHDQV